MQATIGGLPLPMHIGKVFTMVNQQCPDLVKNAFLVPTPQRPMHGGVTAEFFGQLIPLTARSGPIDDPVETAPLICTGSPHSRGRVKFSQQRLKKVLPHLV
jgi:hypothetical protein